MYKGFEYNSPPRVNVLNVGISVVNLEKTLNIIESWIEKRERNYVCVRDVHGVMECQRHQLLMEIHNSSGLTVPDGMPLVWAGRLNGEKSIGRVYGPDLMAELCRLSVKKGYTHFFCGGKEGVAELLQKNIECRFPGIKIVGRYYPPFRPLTESEEGQLYKLTAHLKPDIFWVGISTPKQEYFMWKYFNKLETTVMLGVGAAFDIHAGLKKDAPTIIKKLSIQWIYRLFQEPRRLWRRYLYNVPAFFYHYSKQIFKEKSSNI